MNPPSCTICSHKVPYSTIHTELLDRFPRFGQHWEGQSVIACSGCGCILHVSCVESEGTSIAWHHLWFSNIRMREFIEEHKLGLQDIALCTGCHERLSEEILANYKALEKFREGARFLEEFGRVDEAFELLAEIKS